MASNLSPKQLEVLSFIRDFLGDHSLPPTRGEIAGGLGLRNRQGIDQHLRALEQKGVIELIPGISRGIRLREETLPAGSATLQSEAMTGLPLLGRVAAGTPLLAAGNIEDRIQIDARLFRPRADFLLRIRGDSMQDADIQDDDLVAVHQTSEPRNGHIVVARIGDEATAKYFRREGHRVRLEPANAAYRPIEIDLRREELTIEGLAVGVIRARLARPR